MRQLMEHLHEQLSEYAPVYYEDMIREEDGSIKIDSINIVYDLTSISSSDNSIKGEIPLIIDIWHPRNRIFDVEDLIDLIDNKFTDSVTNFNNGAVLSILKAPVFYLNIKDPDPNIRRKRLNFILHYYK